VPAAAAGRRARAAAADHSAPATQPQVSLRQRAQRANGFYAQPVCGVSRAALMTGSYPIRVGEPGNLKRLHTVPHPKELTMAEVLRSAGYATGIIGKWHLCNADKSAPGGYELATMPNAQGFDYFYGTPWYNGASVAVSDSSFRSPIFRNSEVIVKAVENWDNITADYTREAVAYITAHREKPFFSISPTTCRTSRSGPRRPSRASRPAAPLAMRSRRSTGPPGKFSGRSANSVSTKRRS
jgi:arylsulfatase A-like enzyme